MNHSSADYVPYDGICPSGFKSPTDTSARIFLDLFDGAILSVVGDVPVDNKASMVTSSISKFAGPTQFFGGRRCL